MLTKALARFALVTIALGGFVSAAAVVPGEDPFKVAGRWARSLTPAERAQVLTGHGIAGLPRIYQRALRVLSQTPDSKALYWNATFDAFRLTHELSSAESDLLERVQSTLTVDSFRHSDESAKRFSVYQAELVRVLGQSRVDELLQTPTGSVDERAFFPSLSLLEQVRYSWSVARAPVGRRIRSFASHFVPVLHAEELPCVCNVTAACVYYLSIAWTCSTAEEICTVDPPGQGTCSNQAPYFGSDRCYGLCVKTDED